MALGSGFGIMRPVALAGSVFGLVALGILSLKYGDLLLQWQPAPRNAAWRTPGAYLSGLILLASGVGLAISSTRRAAAIIASVWIGLWVAFLHFPAAIAANGKIAVVLGLAECAAMALGIASLVGGKSGGMSRLLLLVFGVCLIVFGISHFVYADFTAKMVPAWLPARLAIAYLTGVIHVLTGVCLVIGYSTRLAATLEALMMTSFVALVHIPRVADAPRNRLELTMLAVAVLLTSATWLIPTLGGHRR